MGEGDIKIGPKNYDVFYGRPLERKHEFFGNILITPHGSARESLLLPWGAVAMLATGEKFDCMIANDNSFFQNTIGRRDFTKTTKKS